MGLTTTCPEPMSWNGGTAMSERLRVPWTWPGGKGKMAATCWRYFGEPDVYGEPFAGSLAVLLSKPGRPAKRELVCDTDHFIANFHRAVRAKPESVAAHMDRPTVQCDLQAAKRWLWEWSRDMGDVCARHIDYYSPKAAGLWAWCQSVAVNLGTDKPDAVESLKLNGKFGADGCSRQRINKPFGGDMEAWMLALSERLRDVMVFNRDWRNAVSDCALGQFAGASVAVLLDPPYPIPDGGSEMYADSGPQAAHESYEWAIANGERFRIGYCSHEGDFPVPDGWAAEYGHLVGVSRPDKQRDRIIFSPACIRPAGLFD